MDKAHSTFVFQREDGVGRKDWKSSFSQGLYIYINNSLKNDFFTYSEGASSSSPLLYMEEGAYNYKGEGGKI